jgi:hypothetical protein
VAITLNGRMAANNLTIRNTGHTLMMRLNPGANTLSVRALNIGGPALQKRWKLEPYKSAAIEINGVVGGKTRQQWKLDAGQSASMETTCQL